jgi:hypothetical protein
MLHPFSYEELKKTTPGLAERVDPMHREGFLFALTQNNALFCFPVEEYAAMMNTATEQLVLNHFREVPFLHPPVNTHKVGELIAFSQGEYSDYSFQGLYKVLQDLDLADLAHIFHMEHETNSSYDFGTWLIQRGVVEEVDYHEVHLGSYGFDPKKIREQCASRKKAMKEDVH